MSSAFQINVSEDVLTKNLTIFVVISEIFRRQSQAVVVEDGDDNGLVFDLRANLSEQQYERLIKKEINACLPNYNCVIDWRQRKMMVTREKLNAHKTSRKKSAKPRQQVSPGGDTGVSAVN